MAEQHPAPAHTADEDPGIVILLAAAQAVTDGIGTPGAAHRYLALGAALDYLTETDPLAAVIAASALWRDRYGASGAPKRLAELRAAVEAQRGPAQATGPSIEDMIESGQFTGTPQSVSDVLGDDYDTGSDGRG
jgi:hypothetical protein